MTDWKKVNAGGRPALAEVLREILDDAAGVDPKKLTGDALNKRILAVQKDLLEFIDESDNDVAKDLDGIAHGAIDDLTQLSIQDALRGIASRTAELARLTKDLGDVTAEAGKSALFLSLDPVKKAVATAAQAISAFNDLKKQIKTDAPDAEQVAEQIEALLDQLQTLRNAIERA